MATAWCPRCQKQVRVDTREVRNPKTRETRTESLCAECGILLTARTQKAGSAAVD